MNRARKSVKTRFDCEHAKVAVRVFQVVRAVNLVAFEGDRILDLVGRRGDANGDAEPVELP
jgi:hypothetical protein